MIDSISFKDIQFNFTADDFGTIASFLTIENATVNDTGLYRCVADSEGYSSVSTDEALVLVQG